MPGSASSSQVASNHYSNSVVNQDVKIVNTVPSAAVADAIVRQVLAHLDRKMATAARTSTSTPRTY
jgi:hypothetical protein